MKQAPAPAERQPGREEPSEWQALSPTGVVLQLVWATLLLLLAEAPTQVALSPAQPAALPAPASRFLTLGQGLVPEACCPLVAALPPAAGSRRVLQVLQALQARQVERQQGEAGRCKGGPRCLASQHRRLWDGRQSSCGRDASPPHLARQRRRGRQWERHEACGGAVRAKKCAVKKNAKRPVAHPVYLSCAAASPGASGLGLQTRQVTPWRSRAVSGRSGQWRDVS